MKKEKLYKKPEKEYKQNVRTPLVISKICKNGFTGIKQTDYKEILPKQFRKRRRSTVFLKVVP
jgi:hypothetical protein